MESPSRAAREMSTASRSLKSCGRVSEDTKDKYIKLRAHQSSNAQTQGGMPWGRYTRELHQTAVTQEQLRGRAQDIPFELRREA
eukprot:1150358-Pelagomonas_calceolata.AAC.2